MRYRLQSLWLLLVVILGSVSCTKSNDLNEPKLEKKAFLSTEFSTELSDEEAIKQAQSLYSIIGAKDAFRSASLPRIKNVLRSKNSDKLRSSEGDASSEAGFVVVNFENDKGFVLLSDDKLSEPLLGFSDKGYLDLSQVDNPNTSFILENTKEKARYGAFGHKYCSECGSLIPPKNSGITIIKMSEFPCSEDVCNYQFRKDAEKDEWKYTHTVEYGPFKCVLRIDPLVPVEWKQGAPHNNKIDKGAKIVNGKIVERAPVGCVATAVSQIMAYHRYPNSILGKSIDWARIIANKNLPYSADILADLHKDLGQKYLLDMDYDYQNGSSALSSNVPRTLRHYGYKSGELIGFNMTDVKNEIKAHRPLYMRGKRYVDKARTKRSGHAWVVDGLVILEREVTIRERLTNEIYMIYDEQKEFIHCNVGWGPYYNGYYLSRGFNFNDSSILDDKLNVKSNRSFKTDSLQSKYTFGFNVIKNIER